MWFNITSYWEGEMQERGTEGERDGGWNKKKMVGDREAEGGRIL